MREFEYNEDFDDLGLPWAGHRYFAMQLVELQKPSSIVELGTWRGTSMFSMLQGVKNQKLTTEFNAIDTWEGDKHAGFYEGDEYLAKINAILKKHYSSCAVKLIRDKFENAIHLFKDESIDLIHIDGLHTYEAVLNDYNLWRPKLSKNGIILFHDISEKRDGFGVWKLWEEIKSEIGNHCFSFNHSHGLGILTFSKNTSISIGNLIQKVQISNLEKINHELIISRNNLEYTLNSIYNSRYWRIKEKIKYKMKFNK
ncbi:MAG: hypothetical protein RL308_1230 [Bacteroidota bacterium]|jgi:hypothetical protein